MIYSLSNHRRPRTPEPAVLSYTHARTHAHTHIHTHTHIYIHLYRYSETLAGKALESSTPWLYLYIYIYIYLSIYSI